MGEAELLAGGGVLVAEPARPRPVGCRRIVDRALHELGAK
jgi:hypothetical protein